MRILIIYDGIIPVRLYGGTERVIWSLGKELTKMGHKVTFLVKEGSYCDFATVIPLDKKKPVVRQITKDYDIVHFHFRPENIESLRLPYIITKHDNTNNTDELDRNTVFISKNHAARHNSGSYVYNGLDWSEYVPPVWNVRRNYFHFLGNAAWRVKNVAGAIDVIKKTKTEKLKVLGGLRFNIKMGVRFTLSPKIDFLGMVGEAKDALLNGSKGLVFPVRWHEPFGLAIIESLYYGCPVFGTPYGSLRELVMEDVGYLSNKINDLKEAVLNADKFSSKKCHEYANEEFNSRKMATAYLKKYDKAMASKPLNNDPPKLKEIQSRKFLDWG